MSPTRKSTQRNVIVQEGRSAKGRSQTAEGAAGQSVTASDGERAKGGKGASVTAEGGSAVAGLVKVQTTDA